MINRFIVHVAFFCLSFNSILCDSGRWEYSDQDNWPETCRTGRQQSPINLPDICYPSSLVTNGNRSRQRSAPLTSNSTSNSTDRERVGGGYGQGNYQGNNNNNGYNNNNNGGYNNNNNNNNSPIQIDRNLRINLINYNQQLSNQYLKIKNTGHTISMTLVGSEDEVNREAPTITGSAADGDMYQFVEAHFHWDQQDTTGSEHSISGKRTALEMHLVHYNTRYSNKKEAASKPDGLLVLGVFFREDTRTNPRLKPIVDQIAYVRQTNSTSNARHSFSLRSILPEDLSTFYKYHGSLTTPPCSESVTWVLLAQTENIGYNQLNSFQQIQSRGDKLRRIQPANGRPIWASSDRHCGTSGDDDDHDDDNNSAGVSGFTTARPPIVTGSNGRPGSSQQGFENNNRPGYGSNSGRPNGGEWSQGAGNNGGYDRPGQPRPPSNGQGGYGGPQGQSGFTQRPGNNGNFGSNNRPNNGGNGWGYLENGRPDRVPNPTQPIFPTFGWQINQPNRPGRSGRRVYERRESAERALDTLTDSAHFVQIPQPVISFEPVVVPV